MSLEALINSAGALKKGVQTAAAQVPAQTLKPATPTAQGLQQLLQATQMPQTQMPTFKAQPMRPNADRGIRKVFPDKAGKEAKVSQLRTPSMSPEMRELMMRGRNAAV